MNILIKTSQKEECRQAIFLVDWQVGWFGFVIQCLVSFPFLLVHLVVKSHLIAGNVTDICSRDFLGSVSSIRKNESVSKGKSQHDRQSIITSSLFAERDLLVFVMQDLREILSNDQQRSLEEVKPHSSFKENKKEQNPQT